MSNRNLRIGCRLAIASGAVVFLLASAAFACTNYRGKMKVTGNAAGSGTAEAVGLKQDGGMNYCSDPRNTGPATVDGPGVGRITVEVSTGTCGSNTSTLDAGTYTVTWSSNFGRDCMGQVGGLPEAVLGTFQVDASGNGTQDYDIPAVATGVNDTAAVCLTSTTQSGALQGNKAPLNVI